LTIKAFDIEGGLSGCEMCCCSVDAWLLHYYLCMEFIEHYLNWITIQRCSQPRLGQRGKSWAVYTKNKIVLKACRLQISG